MFTLFAHAPSLPVRVSENEKKKKWRDVVLPPLTVSETKTQRYGIGFRTPLCQPDDQVHGLNKCHCTWYGRHHSVNIQKVPTFRGHSGIRSI